MLTGSEWEAPVRELITWGCHRVKCPHLAGDGRIVVRFNSRMRTAMGRAWTNYSRFSILYSPEWAAEIINPMRLVGGLIGLSTRLWERAPEAERRKTTLHELAHIVANIRYGGSQGHNKRWKQVMVELGETPDRCHSVSVAGLRQAQARFLLTCPKSCGWSYTLAKARLTRRINKARQGEIRMCPRCREPIMLADWMGAEPV